MSKTRPERTARQTPSPPTNRPRLASAPGRTSWLLPAALLGLALAVGAGVLAWLLTPPAPVVEENRRLQAEGPPAPDETPEPAEPPVAPPYAAARVGAVTLPVGQWP